eukprot:s1604_g9.t1
MTNRACLDRIADELKETGRLREGCRRGQGRGRANGGGRLGRNLGTRHAADVGGLRIRSRAASGLGSFGPSTTSGSMQSLCRCGPSEVVLGDACILGCRLCLGPLAQNMTCLCETARALALTCAPEDFLATKRQDANVALLLHDANCPHCRKALPELDRVAEDFRSEGVIFAHADCTHGKGSIQNEFNLKGFPGFLFWRQSAPLEELVDQVFVVDTDVDFILRSSRLAEIGKERDGARRALAGVQVTVKATDSKDMTVQVEGPSGQLVWIPHETLLKQGRRLPYRRGDGVARYRNVWEKDLALSHQCCGSARIAGILLLKEPMTQFLRRMMQPLVTSLPSPTLASLDGEGPALLLCSRTLTRGFLEAAVTHQLSMRAFQAAEFNKPLKLPFLAHSQFKTNVQNFLANLIRQHRHVLVPYHLPTKTVHQALSKALWNHKRTITDLGRDWKVQTCQRQEFAKKHPRVQLHQGHVATGLETLNLPKSHDIFNNVGAGNAFFPSKHKLKQQHSDQFQAWIKRH